ncbi:MAG: Fic family protein [Gammaproteobacteria bacterium]|nr:MAG: Fic family protein [Gammaproteobacteria bacterium]
MHRQVTRYQAQGAEAEFEPGSRGRVLRNRLGIRLVREMERVESEALLAATERLVDETSEDKQFAADDVRHIHQIWLGEIYAWAGEYRNVNITKSGFPFAAAAEIPRLMQEFSRGPLRQYTPCDTNVIQEQEEALAVVHAELILIHPFREGNGRCARVLSTLMALQTDLPPLDFTGIRGAEKQRYIAAIHAALDRNYEPMKLVMRRVIERSLRSYAKVT